jgi:hypothetical protein
MAKKTVSIRHQNTYWERIAYRESKQSVRKSLNTIQSWFTRLLLANCTFVSAFCFMLINTETCNTNLVVIFIVSDCHVAVIQDVSDCHVAVIQDVSGCHVAVIQDVSDCYVAVIQDVSVATRFQDLRQYFFYSFCC